MSDGSAAAAAAATAALQRVVDAVGEAPDPAAVLQECVEALAGGLSADGLGLYVGDASGGRLELRASAGSAAGLARLIPPGGISDQAGAGRVVPVRVGGRTLGGLAVLRPAGAGLSAGEAALAAAAAQTLVMAVRQARLSAGLRDRVRELDRQARRLDALTRVAERVAACADEAGALGAIAAESRVLTGADAALVMAAEGGGPLRPAAGDGPWGGPPPHADDLARALDGGRVGRGRRRGAVAIPGAGPEGPAVIAVMRSAGEPFDEDDIDRLAGLAHQAGAALANARLVADLRREREERRSLAEAIVLAQESERRRVAEDLHDGPVQELVGVGLMLDALVEELGGAAPEAAADARRAAAAAREAVRGLRRAMADLHPLALEEQGLAAATRALVQRLEWQGVSVGIDLGAAEALPPVTRTVAFRIIQEAVANVARHAGATRTEISARPDEGGVTIEVRDDGRGFDTARRRPGAAAGHLGLAAIEERAGLAGGALTIDSAPGQGTTVRVRLPAGAPPEGAQPGPESRSSAADRAASSAKRSSTTT